MKKPGKRVLSLAVSLGMGFSLVGGTGLTGLAATESSDRTWYDNEPTATEFTISTESEMLALAEIVSSGEDNFYGDTITLTADLDMSAYEDFAGVGTDLRPFTGTFDGADHTVRVALGETSAAAALFAYVDEATIQNLVVDGTVESTYSSGYTAGLVGYVVGEVTITDCVNKADVSGTQYAGGLVGYVVNAADITDCVNSGDVSGTQYVGGLVGYAMNDALVNISGCINEGTVTGSGSYVGGIAGQIYAGTVLNTVNESTGVVTGTGNVGGILGYVQLYTTCAGTLTIDKCLNYASITGTSDNVGGIVGYVYGISNASYAVTIEECGNEGTISNGGGDTGAYTGGIVGGIRGTYVYVQSVYNAGSVSGYKWVGGIIGRVYSTPASAITDVYNVGAINGYGGTGIAGLVGYASYTFAVSNAYTTGEVQAEDLSTYGIYYGLLFGNCTKKITVDNIYYLSTLSGSLDGYGDSYLYNTSDLALSVDELAAMAKTADELTVLASTLGESFKDNGNSDYHEGYPVLAWEEVPASEAETYDVDTTGLMNISLSDDSAATATEGEDYIVTLVADDGYTLPDTVTVTVEGTELTADEYSYDAETGVLTVYADAVTGTIAITAAGVEEVELQIITQPEDYAGIVGSTATFTVEATGSGLTYQWQFINVGAVNWHDSGMTGATTATLSVPVISTRDGQQYRCVVTDENGNSVTSDSATITVLEVYDVDITGLTNMSLSEDNEATAVEGEEYCATLVVDDGYTLPDTIMVTAGGTELTADDDYSYDAETGVLTVYADAVTGTIAITAAGVEETRELQIITQPEDYTGDVGSTAVFEVEATGNGLTYQWQYMGSSSKRWHNSGMTGADTATLSVIMTEARDGQQYRCVVTDKYGDSLTSDVVTLSLPADAFTITLQPADYTGLAGSTATFTVEADGTGLTYQWQYSSNGTLWYDSGKTGSDTATLSVIMTEARGGQQYRCIVTDENGDSVTSDTATLILASGGGIEITVQPTDYTGAVGDTATFSVEATGDTDLTYQWQYMSSGGAKWHDSGMTGADTATISVTATEARNGQQYRCVITDEDGNMAVSDVVTISVE